MSLRDEVQVIECRDSPIEEGSTPSPDQGAAVSLEMDSEHCLTFQNVCYEVRGLNRCQLTRKRILGNVRYRPLDSISETSGRLLLFPISVWFAVVQFANKAMWIIIFFK